MSAVRFFRFIFVIFTFLSMVGGARAQGLFDVLFNSHPQPQYYRYAPREGMRFDAPRSRYSNHWRRSARSATAAHSAAVKRAIARKKTSPARVQVASLDHSEGATADAKPTTIQNSVCCTGGSVAEIADGDRTLRKGDALMTDEGLKIYSGRSSQHSGAGFVEIRRAKMSKTEYSRFHAVLTADNLPQPRQLTEDPAVARAAKPPAPNISALPPEREKDLQTARIRTIGPYRVYHQTTEAPKAEARRIQTHGSKI